MQLLNPAPSPSRDSTRLARPPPRHRRFFEAKGKRRLKDDDRDRVWYRDFLDFQKEKKLFATFLTRGRSAGPAPGGTRTGTAP